MSKPFVLLVEDDPLVGRATRRQLAAFCEVVLVTTRDEALARVAQRRPDAVLCDYQLGDETAVRLLETLRKLEPTMRCVLYSATRAELVAPLFESGLVDDWVEKPGTLARLRSALRLL